MMSTIQISKETKELLSSFGTKSDSYEDIIKRLYDIAVKDQLRRFEESAKKDSLTLEEARRIINQKYPKK